MKMTTLPKEGEYYQPTQHENSLAAVPLVSLQSMYVCMYQFVSFCQASPSSV